MKPMNPPMNLFAISILTLTSLQMTGCGSSATTAASTLSSQLGSALSAKLVAAGLTQSQADALVNAGTTQANTAASSAATAARIASQARLLSLTAPTPVWKNARVDTLAADADLTLVGPAFMEGIIGALDEEAAGLTTTATRVAAITTITEGITDFVRENSTEIAAAGALDTCLGGILAAGNSSLNEAGIPASEASSALNAFIGTMLANVQDFSFTNEQMRDIAADLAQYAADGIRNNGWSSSEYATNLGYVSEYMIAGMDNAGVAAADLPAMTEIISGGVALGLSRNSGLTEEQRANYLEYVSQGFTRGIDDAGIGTTSSYFDEMLGSVTAGLISQADGMGFSSAYMDDAMARITEGATAGLAGISGYTASSAAQWIQYINVGATSALNDLGTLTDADRDRYSEAMSSGCTQAMGAGGLGFDSTQYSSALQYMIAGAVEGMGAAGYSESQINALRDNIVTGASAGLSATGFTADQITTYSNTLTTYATTYTYTGTYASTYSSSGTYSTGTYETGTSGGTYTPTYTPPASSGP